MAYANIPRVLYRCLSNLLAEEADNLSSRLHCLYATLSAKRCAALSLLESLCRTRPCLSGCSTLLNDMGRIHSYADLTRRTQELKALPAASAT